MSEAKGSAVLPVRLVSFGYQYGSEPSAGYVMNVHSMVPGPDKEMRKYDGTFVGLQKQMFASAEFKTNYKNEILRPVLKFIKHKITGEPFEDPRKKKKEEEEDEEEAEEEEEEEEAEEEEEEEEEEEAEEEEEEKDDGVIVIAIGCDQGKHRSVATVERLAIDIPKTFAQCDIEIVHRDVAKDKTDAQRSKQRNDRRKEKRNQHFYSDDY
jgi:RNase adaptor protein for sRNA GlmZ degradation